MIEYADAEARSAAAALSRAPAHIVAAVNRSRVRQGLTPIAYRRQEPPRPIAVLWDSRSPRNPARKSKREEAAARCEAIRQRADAAISRLKLRLASYR